MKLLFYVKRNLNN